MRTFRVTWTIDVEAGTPHEAAEHALAIQRRADSTATVFDVLPHPCGNSVRVDLLEDDEVAPLPPASGAAFWNRLKEFEIHD